jgi:hypothetical protein
MDSLKTLDPDRPIREADYICLQREFPLLTDAVEKVGSALPERNNGIKTNNILNRCCVFASSLESMLLGKAPKIFFQQYRP